MVKKQKNNNKKTHKVMQQMCDQKYKKQKKNRFDSQISCEEMWKQTLTTGSTSPHLESQGSKRASM